MDGGTLSLYAGDAGGLTRGQIARHLADVLAGCDLSGDVLIIPPDYTRMHSGGGLLTAELHRQLTAGGGAGAVHILPALGTHLPVTPEEKAAFFGDDIPDESFFIHNWRTDVVKIGEVPASFLREVSEGLIDQPLEIEVNRRLLDGRYRCILSLGQVVPHEVVGMANYTKNILVGVGGSRCINLSHLLGAMYGMERMMGRENTPVRAVFDYAQERFLSRLPITYVLTVATNTPGGVAIHGLFSGRERAAFSEACALAKEKNLIFVDEPFQKAVVYLDPREFKSTWLGNKAIYRTRMAMAEGGELIVLAPGVERFGEDAENDRLIRKYGYRGRSYVIERLGAEEDLRRNQSVAAHLIHSSPDGRFSVVYATRLLTRGEVEGAGFAHLPYEEAARRYPPETLSDGYNVLPGGERIFYISNPALGLWSLPF